jgi:hypothetical protein
MIPIVWKFPYNSIVTPGSILVVETQIGVGAGVKVIVGNDVGEGEAEGVIVCVGEEEGVEEGNGGSAGPQAVKRKMTKSMFGIIFNLFIAYPTDIFKLDRNVRDASTIRKV